MKRLLFFCLAIAGLLPLSLYAQKSKGTAVDNKKEASQQRIFALVIGISNYENLPKLEYADKDALAFRDYLLDVQKVPASQIHCLTNDSASSINIFDKLYQIEDALKPNDQFIFYFSGHGDWESRITENSLLLLKKAPSKNYLRRKDQLIESDDLNDFIQKMAGRQIKTLLIADACRSGNLVGGKEGISATVAQLQNNFGNSIRILSCMPDELSFESAKWGGGRGVFSYYLTLGLMGVGKKNPTTNLELTLAELRNFLEENVSRETGGKQNPVLVGDPRTIVSRVENHNENIAKTLVKSTDNSVAVRGKGVLDTNDAAYRRLLTKFSDELQRGNLVMPAGQCAFTTYKHLLAYGPESYFADQRQGLLEKVTANFLAFSEKYYDESVYTVEELVQLRHEIIAASRLVPNNKYLLNRLTSNRLFIDACLSLNTGEMQESRVVSQSQLDKAIDSLEKAISLTPHEPFLYHMLGNCYLLTNPTLAIDNFNHYVSLLPNDASAYNAIGFAYYKLKRYQNAATAFQKAISRNSKSSRYYYNLAMCYQAMGMEGEAARMFRKSQNVGQPVDETEY